MNDTQTTLNIINDTQTKEKIMKLGIHSSNWDKLIVEIRENIPEPYLSVILKILRKYSTPYF